MVIFFETTSVTVPLENLPIVNDEEEVFSDELNLNEGIISMS